MVGLLHGGGWHVSWAGSVRANRIVSDRKRYRGGGIDQGSSVMLWGAREDRATTAVDGILEEMVQNLPASQRTWASVNVFSHWQPLPILNDEGVS